MNERRTHFRTQYRWDLTPRQREVLDRIAQGKTNAEIADELGITLDGAKYHVREILGKLGAESREEAVALWTQRQRPLARLTRAFTALAAGGATRWIVAGSVAVTLAVAFAVGVVLIARVGDHNDSPAQSSSDAPETPVATASTATPSPTPTAFPDARDVALVDDIPLPPSTMLLIGESGYGHGVGGIFQLRRVYRLGLGDVHDDVLIPIEEITGKGRLITGIVPGPQGALMMSRCEGAPCVNEGTVKDVVTVFLRSDDGGVTWREVYRREGRWWVRAAGFDQWYAISFAEGAPVIAVPSGADVPRPPSADAISLPVDGNFWLHGGLPVFVDGSGDPVLDSGLTADFHVSGFLRGRGTVFAATRDEDGVSTGYIVARDQLYAGVYRLPRWVELVALIEPNRVVVNLDFTGKTGCGEAAGQAPAIFDFNARTLAFVAELFTPECRGGAYSALAVRQGIDARVETPGDCLNLREEPSEEAAVVTCLPHGTLVGIRLGLEPSERWWPVQSPIGLSGWVDSAYLVR
jgi:DNA-binding CsgD family transcriptional regulator